MKHSDLLDKLAPDFVKAQSEVRGAIKDSNNPFFNSSYADLESVWSSCRDILSKNNLSVIQGGNGKSLETMLLHSSGQWISGDMEMIFKDQTPQSQGSSLTYLRRYGLAAMVGIVQVDDDGNAASVPDKKDSKEDNIPQFKPPQSERTRGGLTQKQLGRLVAIKKNVNMPDETLEKMATNLGIISKDEMTKSQYEQLCTTVEKWVP